MKGRLFRVSKFGLGQLGEVEMFRGFGALGLSPMDIWDLQMELLMDEAHLQSFQKNLLPTAVSPTVE